MLAGCFCCRQVWRQHGQDSPVGDMGAALAPGTAHGTSLRLHPCGKAVKVRFCCFYCVACPRLNKNVIRELAFSLRDLV